MTRACTCPHRFAVCACAEGWKGEALLRRSRRLSEIAGLPLLPEPEPTAPRPAKPRMALGVSQHPPVDCIPCQQAAKAQSR